MPGLFQENDVDSLAQSIMNSLWGSLSSALNIQDLINSQYGSQAFRNKNLSIALWAGSATYNEIYWEKIVRRKYLNCTNSWLTITSLIEYEFHTHQAMYITPTLSITWKVNHHIKWSINRIIEFYNVCLSNFFKTVKPGRVLLAFESTEMQNYWNVNEK